MALSLSACGDEVCPAPSDPRQRGSFVLRLQSLLRPPVHHIEGGRGEQVSAQWLAQQQRRVDEAAAKDPVSWLSRGAGEAHAGRYAAAQPLLQQALDLSVAQNDSLAEAASLANLGVVAALLGRYDDARRRMDQALQKFQSQLSEPRLPPRLEATPTLRLPPGVVLSPAQLAEFQSSNRSGHLRRELEQARRGAFLVLLNQGSLAAHLQQYTEAVPLLKRAEAAADPKLKDGGRRTALGELQLLYRRTGRIAEAADHDRLASAAPRAEEERWQFQTSEVALAPSGAEAATRVSGAAPAAEAATVAAQRSAAERPLPPAAQQLKDQLEAMMMAAGQRQMAQIMPSAAACGGAPCKTPSEPGQRTSYVLRLAGVIANPMTAAANAAALSRPGGGSSAAMVNAAGVKQATNGRLDVALAEWTRALQASGDQEPQTLAAVRSNLGVAAAMQGRHDDARLQWQEALKIYGLLAATRGNARQATGSPGPWGMDPAQIYAMFDSGAGQNGVLLVMLNLAHLEAHLGRQAEADQWLRQAGDHVRRGRHGSALVHNESAAIDRLRGRPQAAAEHLHRAREGSRTDELWQQIEVGFVNLPVTASASPGIPAPSRPGLAATAPAPAPPPSARPASDRDSLQAAAAESMHARLGDEAARLELAGDVAGALAAHGRAAITAAAAGNAERERAALAALQRLRAARGEAGASIIHGKRVANAVQRQRQSLVQLTPAARRAFLEGRTQAYVLLAQTLIDRNRLPETEQVLRLLKEDEGQQLEESPVARGVVPYSIPETSVLKAFDQLADRIRPLETQRARLAGGLSADGVLDSRAAIERARLRALNRAEEVIATFEANAGDVDKQVMACRQAIAKKNRSPSEVDQLAECALGFSAMAQALARGSESVRALKRDAAVFTARASAVETRQIDTVLGRYAALQSRLARAFALARELPPAPASEVQATANTLAMVLETGRLQELWALQVEIDELASGAVALDAALDGVASPPEFAPDATAVLHTGMRLMKALPPGTLALYYLQGDNRLDIVAVGASGWHRAQVRVTRSEMARHIAAMRSAVSDPRRDAVVASQAMYALLVAPLEEVLKVTRASTLMVALEGPLRYVPFAALHDGRGWLVERYALSLYTTAAPTSLTAQPTRHWRVAAFGNSQPGTDGPNTLEPLPGVRKELQAIVRERGRPGQGVMDGEIRLDGDFTARALSQALRSRPNVLHIASHFVFKPDDAAASFLLLGNDEKLTLAQLGGADFRFNQIDLVTLSACDTALVAANGFGQEVEALGTLLQSRGAAAVLSTLWPAADDSTAQFMRLMYDVRQAGAAPVSRAQALRSAQMAFIGSGTQLRAMPAETPAGARGAQRPGAERRDPKLPYAHPFFWAPFVLMGNWL